MTDAAANTDATERQRVRTGSMGQKLLLVCGLALLMTIPALFVFALLHDRTSRAEQVEQEIGGLAGGQQVFMGPVLAIPYHRPPPPTPQDGAQSAAEDRGPLIVFPTAVAAEVAETSEVRARSLFKVPVYKADITFHSHFDLSQVIAPPNATLEWDRAEFLIGASEPRGAQAEASLTVDGKSSTFSPATLVSEWTLLARDNTALPPGQIANTGGQVRFFGRAADPVAKPGAAFDTDAHLKFSGARRYSLLPVGKTTTVSAKGDWPAPSFDGGFLPVNRTVTAAGFTANWSVPFIARGVPAQGGMDLIGRLGRSDLGVTFADPANPYQSVARSLKYALLFVGLVFLAYFLFEATTGKRLHPAQYVLIGLAQIIFYLLLLSLAERLGFDLGFLLSGGATVGLISAYAGWVFDSRMQGVRALIGFSFLYLLIYVLMRLEDYALLVGALASFAAVAAVMYFTRKLDWYSVANGLNSPAAAPVRPHMLEDNP